MTLLCDQASHIMELP